MIQINCFRDNLISQGYSKSTIEQYLRDISQLAQWFIDNNAQHLDINMISLGLLQSYRNYLYHRNLNPSTIERKMASIRRFLIWGKENNFLGEKIDDNVDTISFETQGEDVDKFTRCINYLGSSRDKAIMALLLDTNIKPEGILNLKVTDVNLTEKVIGLLNNKLILSQEVFSKLESHLNTRENKEAIFVFTNKAGEKLTLKTIHYLIKKYAQLAGVTNINLKVLRKYCALQLLQKGTDVGTIVELLHKIP